MRLSCLRIIAVIMCFVLMVSCFSGCIFRLFGADEEEVVTFDFEGYNSLEVVVSDSEKFILFFTEEGIEYLKNNQEDHSYSGYGEWIKDGVARPVYIAEDDADNAFFDYTDGIRIDYDKEKDFYADSYITENYSNTIAIIVNNAKEPTLRWYSDGGYNSMPYTWGDTVPVTVSTVNRDLNEKWSYISEAWTEFASVDREKGTRFVCNEQNFFYDAGLCEGEWNVNGTKIPIRIEFKEDRPCMEIYDTRYDTRGDRLILTAEGYEIIDENTIKFNNLTGNMFYSDTVKSITIIKENYSTGEELTDGES